MKVKILFQTNITKYSSYHTHNQNRLYNSLFLEMFTICEMHEKD